MKPAVLLFSEYRPDLAALDNAGLTVANNCLPMEGVYKSFSALNGITNAVNARAQGAFTTLDVSGNVKQYCGTSSKLYDRAADTWTDRSGAAYSTAATGYWKFAHYANRVMATNGVDEVQSVLTSGTTFGDLDSTAPVAKHIGVVGEFTMLGYTDDATNGPVRVHWSPIGDPAGTWETPGTQAAADVQTGAENLNPAYGYVTHVCNGEQWNLVFQQRAITRFTYVGGAAIFQVDTFYKERGAWYPNAVAQVGNIAYFPSFDGFYACDGETVIPIGAGKVDRMFTDEVDDAYPERVTVAVDLSKKLIVWSFPGSGSSSGGPNKLLAYNFAENRWSTCDQTCELVFSGKSTGYTLEGLDAISASLDALGISLDSSQWQGGIPVMAGFYTDHKAGTFNGTVQTAQIDTGEMNINRGGMATVTGVKPLVEGTTATSTVTLGTRALLSDSVAYGSASSTHSRSGIAPFRTTSRYVRARVSISGGFDRAMGVEAYATEAGAV